MKTNLKEQVSKVFNLLDIEEENERIHIQYLLVLNILCFVSVAMTIVNALTHWERLGFITGAFAVACVVAAFMEYFFKNKRIARTFFAFSMIAMFTAFLVLGDPKGFSVMWILMLPACGFFLFGLKWGLVVNGIQILIVIFFTWTSIGNELLQFEYTDVFLQRFPMVYLAFTGVGILLETVRLNAQTKLDNAKKEFERMYNHDVLTGLYNRYGFNSSLDEFLKQRKDESFAFAIIDLDKFKSVNDTYGHNNGDLVLQNVAQRTSEFFKDRAVVCRWGGEEFSLLIKSGKNAEKQCNALIELARTTQIQLDTCSIIETFSLGLVIVDEGQAVDPARLVKLADTNLYLAKQAGRNRVVTSTYNETQEIIEK